MTEMESSEVELSEEELVQQGYRKYRGKAIDVYYNIDLCNHTGVCSRENELVFDPSSRPWILVDLAPAEEVIRVVRECPTGALKYKWKDEDGVKPE